MEKLEKEILSIIQQNFPICPDPYGEIGSQVGCTRETAFETINALHDKQLIRRIGGSFSAQGMGYTSTLVGAKIDPEKIEAIAEYATSFMEVTHNYERSNDYNLWYTIIAESKEKLDDIFNSIKSQPGVIEMHQMPAEKFFKLKVDFKFD